MHYMTGTVEPKGTADQTLGSFTGLLGMQDTLRVYSLSD